MIRPPMRLHPIATPGDRLGQAVTDHLSRMSTTLRAAKSGQLHRFVSYDTFRQTRLVQAPLHKNGGNHGHYRRTPVSGPFIAICFPLASLCASMATSHSHPRHGAIIWLDRDAGLGRIGFGRSNLKVPLHTRCPTRRVYPPNHQANRKRPTAIAKAIAEATAYGNQSPCMYRPFRTSRPRTEKGRAGSL